MPLRFLIDEHLRGKFTQALIERGLTETAPVHVLEVGDDDAPPLGTKDPQLIRWAALNGRLIVSLDDNTLPEHLENHVAAGFESPGVLFIRRHKSWDEVLFFLVLISGAGFSDEYRDRCTYIPF